MRDRISCPCCDKSGLWNWNLLQLRNFSEVFIIEHTYCFLPWCDSLQFFCQQTFDDVWWVSIIQTGFMSGNSLALSRPNDMTWLREARPQNLSFFKMLLCLDEQHLSGWFLCTHFYALIVLEQSCLFYVTSSCDGLISDIRSRFFEQETLDPEKLGCMISGRQTCFLERLNRSLPSWCIQECVKETSV